MARDSLNRVRRALDAGPQPYAHLDVALATRLGGAIFLVGIAYALLVLPLSPPRGPLGAVGVAACVASAAAVGWHLLRRPSPADPRLLLALCYAGVAIATLYRASAGPASPFHQLLFLAVMYTAAVHPARRAAGVIVAATASAASPMLYGGIDGHFAALTVSHVALTWSLALIILIWSTRVRHLRREGEAAREEAERHARIDALTGLGNRRALEEALAAAVADARRHGRPLAVLVADLDGFKGINDAFGHPAGDAMLRAAARAVTSALRLPDPCFRWGGDEFVALLPEADLEEAQSIALRVREAVDGGCRRPDGQPLGITVGSAELEPADSSTDLLARADAALLAAKAARAVAVG